MGGYGSHAYATSRKSFSLEFENCQGESQAGFSSVCLH